jgi:hypothetical protein
MLLYVEIKSFQLEIGRTPNLSPTLHVDPTCEKSIHTRFPRPKEGGSLDDIFSSVYQTHCLSYPKSEKGERGYRNTLQHIYDIMTLK